MGLFKPAWMKDKNEQAAIRAIQYVKEEDKLEQAALGAPFLGVRIEAVRKVTNQKFLFDYLSALAADSSLSIRAGFPELAKAAILSLKDPALMKQLALRDPWFGNELVRYIHNQDDLCKIARHPNGYATNLAAICRLRDPEALLQFMETGSDSFREAAQDALNTCLADLRNRPEMTAEQNRRYRAVLLRWPEEAPISRDLSLPYMEEDDLWVLFREAHKTKLRTDAAHRLIRRTDPARLRALNEDVGGIIRELKAKGDRTASSWENEKRLIGERLAELDAADPARLLDNIRDAGLGFDAGVSCLRQLFDPKLDNTQNIAALRDEAAAAVLERVPAWAGSGPHDPYLYRIGRAFPADAAAKYGFTVTQYEVAGEDEFGRYTNTCTDVSYQGRKLSARA